ncbi:MAG TPA: prepilin-type N-terminal cleavage/methylation domain-containing protein [Opitutales bacterium]|nr:prepilin-type N-terminal cleavage/methylation domain-containing protein [Opitutales bacterium]
MKPPRHHAGFSLVETLVAMFIFILAIGVLSESAANAIRAISSMTIEDGSENNFQFLRDVMLTVSDTDSLGLGGEVATPTGGQGHWDAETETTDTPDYFKINLKMSISGKGDVKAETATETLYVLRPQWSQTQDRQESMNTIHDALPNIRTQQNWP